ncbi:MAG: hypothetical protein IH905_12720 [Proteobacteria bacterium]|nr:hypothetical protein [Pseudomonadota bacterium]
MNAGGQALIRGRMLRTNDRHNGAVERLDLEWKPKFLLLALAVLADDRGAGSVDMADLRVMTCLRENAIQKHLGGLERRGLVTITERPASTSGDARIVYTLPFAAEGRPS